MNDNKLKTAGILSAISTLLYAYSIYLYNMPFYISNVLYLSIMVMISISCFIRDKAGNIFHYITFGCYTLHMLYSVIQYAPLVDILFLIACIFILLAKIRNKVFAIAGTCEFVVCGIFILLYFSRVQFFISGMYGIINLIYFAHTVLKFIALFLIWWANAGRVFSKKTVAQNALVPETASLESELVALQQLYNDEKINRQEYNYKKSQILNRL